MDIQFIFIIIVLISIFWFASSGFRNVSRFTNVEPTENVYKLDSRYQFPYNPPVNPMAMESTITNSIPASPELFYGSTNTNELRYSGGDSQLISIPLQYNYPNGTEMLRSQPILITPYNRVKYSPGPPTNDVYLS